MNTQKSYIPSPLLFVTELVRGAINLSTYLASFPLLSLVPRGDGHPVMVLPGFLTTDNTTYPLRYFLNFNGYEAKPWEAGVNLGNYEKLEGIIIDNLKKHYQKYNRKVSLVGWSAGGIFARVIANEFPDMVRQVITLGSPFMGIKDKTSIGTLTEIITGKDAEAMEHVILERASVPLKVPTTAIYTRLDGIVSWEMCKNPVENHTTENVEVFASHLGLGLDPMTLICIAERLSQPEDEWRPFKTTLLSKLFYQYPWNKVKHFH